jgi:hypothetical protein
MHTALSVSPLTLYALKRTLRAANGLLSPMGQHATTGDCVPFAGHSGGGITPQVLLRDDVQPVEVHRLGVADHHGQSRGQVQDVRRGVSSDGLAGGSINLAMCACPVHIRRQLSR